MPIVWKMPDGTVRITQIVEAALERRRNPGETTDQAVSRLGLLIQNKTASLQGATLNLVRSADIPADKTKRYAWRLSGSRLIVDTNVPAPEEGIR